MICLSCGGELAINMALMVERAAVLCGLLGGST